MTKQKSRMDGTKGLIDKQIEDAKQEFLDNEALQCKTYLDTFPIDKSYSFLSYIILNIIFYFDSLI